MGLKKFLKPTFAKIVMFVILFVLFAPFIEIGCGWECETLPGGTCPWEHHIASIVSIFQYQDYCYVFSFYGISFTFLIIGLIITYLLSCATIAAADRFRIRNKNKL